MTIDTDVCIIGAGISGISMAGHMGLLCPDRSYTILERRDEIGGTWDLFRYPGVRSDLDMHTLGFDFEPWLHEHAIADGPAILEYLNRIVDERGIRPNIRFGQHVLSANWDSASACWTVTSRGADGRETVLTARWLYFASGYYDYDNPHDAHIPGLADFGGQVVHPQFWPDDLEYSGKNVVVIGSGATAVTVLPVMAKTAASVTMLQRTPTWMAAGPRRDKWGKRFERWFPEKFAYWLTRQKNIALRTYLFSLSRRNPAKLAEKLRELLRALAGRCLRSGAFRTAVQPVGTAAVSGARWRPVQCGEARHGQAGHRSYRRVRCGGVKLQSGDYLPADLVITATGLRMALAGKVAISKDGAPVDFKDHFFYRGTMFSNLPNLSFVFGYLNASWTLRADMNSRYACEVLNHMARTGTEIALPELAVEDEPGAVTPWDYSSGYLAARDPSDAQGRAGSPVDAAAQLSGGQARFPPAAGG